MRKTKTSTTKINYQSDFKLNEVSAIDDTTTPFCYRYRTSGSTSYKVEFDGVNYTNCRRAEDGSLLIVFDNHKLEIGRLQVRREYFLSDSDYADGVCNKVSEEMLDITLTNGRSDSHDKIVVEVYPDYQKGDDGLTPYVGENLNWWIGDEDSGISAGGGSSDLGEITPGDLLEDYYLKDEVDAQLEALNTTLESTIEENLGSIGTILSNI